MNNIDVLPGPDPPLDDQDESGDEMPEFNFDVPAAPRRPRILLDEGNVDTDTDLDTHVHPNAEANAGLAQQIRELNTFLNRKKRAAAQNVMRGAATAYIDQDESGTYDPDKERIHPRRTRKRLKRVDNNDDDEDHEPRARGSGRARTKGYGLLLTLPFESEKGLRFLRSLPAGTMQSDEGNEVHGDLDSDHDDDDEYGGSYGTRRAKRHRKPLKTIDRYDLEVRHLKLTY